MAFQFSPIAARAHDAAVAYVAPRMSPAARINFAHAFDGVTPANFKQRLPNIVGAIVGATADDLALDASVDELTRRMEQAVTKPTSVAPNGGTTRSMGHPGRPENGAPTPAQIEQILRLVGPHLRPDELEALRELLMADEVADFHNATEVGSDSRFRGTNGQLARQRIEQRLGLKLPKVEAVYKPAPPPRVKASDAAGFFARYPEARAIKHA